MPTERFYRLSKEKQNLIYEAARKEFARVPYEKVSINQIVKNAEISRGSFYTYFEDKDDAMKYVMEENYMQMQKVCTNALEYNGGEFLGMLKTLFEYLVEKMQNEKEVMVLVENIFGRKEQENPPECLKQFLGIEANGSWKWLVSKVNSKQMRVKSEDEVRSMMILGKEALYGSLQQYYLHPEQIAHIRELFETKLDIIGHGAYLRNVG